MNIGVMLRQVDELGGIGMFTRNLMTALLRLDPNNRYFLAFRSESQFDRICTAENVQKFAVKAWSKLSWDQVALPRFAKKYKLDVLYNPKLTVPLFSPCKTVLGLTGAEQSVVPEIFKWHDRAYFSIANPLYCRRADAIVTMSHTAADEIVRYLGADRNKIRVIYPSYNEQCRVMVDTDLDDVKQKYGLPDRFILFVGGLAPLKNLSNLLMAFKELEAHIPHKLVIVGFKRWKFKGDVDLIHSLGLTERIVMTGYLPDADLPALYNMAELFVMPSLYEGFGIPVLEAMACACPVLTTKMGCTPEVVGDAALLVDPRDPLEIADGIREILSDSDRRNRLVEKGLERVKRFSWEKCARETLAVFDSVARGRRHSEDL